MQDTGLVQCGWVPSELYDFRVDYEQTRLQVSLRCYGGKASCAAGCLTNQYRLIFDVTPSHPAASRFAQFETGRFGACKAHAKHDSSRDVQPCSHARRLLQPRAVAVALRQVQGRVPEGTLLSGPGKCVVPPDVPPPRQVLGCYASPASTRCTTAATAPTPCPPGRYGGVEDLTTSACSGVCDPGFYCPAGSVSAASPDHKCKAGRFGGSGQTNEDCSGEWCVSAPFWHLHPV